VALGSPLRKNVGAIPNSPRQTHESPSHRRKSWHDASGLTKLQVISGYFALSGLIVLGAGIFFGVDPEELRARGWHAGADVRSFAFLLVGVGILLVGTAALLRQRKRSGAYCAFGVVGLQICQWLLGGSVYLGEIVVASGIVIGILLSWKDLKG